MRQALQHDNESKQPTPLVNAKALHSAARGSLARTASTLLAVLLASTLVGCSLARVNTYSGNEVPATGIGKKVIGVAMKMEGIPYVYGGSAPDGFDCSGLVYYAYGQAGLSVPRTAHALQLAAAHVDPKHVQPGDLLFFSDHKVRHVAIYIGRNTFIHSPGPGRSVETADLGNDYYQKRLVAAGRLIRS